jgi:hypothetical protein
MKIAEWLVGILTLLVSLIFFAQTYTFPKISADPGGLALFPRFFSVLLAGGALCLIVSLLRQSQPLAPIKASLDRYLAAWRKENFAEGATVRLTTLIFVLCTIYPAFIVLVGFLAATILFSFVLMKLFNVKTWLSGLYSVVLGGGLYVAFAVVLEVYLPAGIVIEAIWG